jgi:ATP-dependent Lon protease
MVVRLRLNTVKRRALKGAICLNENRLLFPTVALRGITILPGNVAHFDVSRKKSIEALDEVMMGDQQIFLVAQRDVQTDEPGKDDVFEVGTIANVKQVIRMQGGLVRVLVEGTKKARVMEYEDDGKVIRCEVEVIPRADVSDYEDVMLQGMARSLEESFSHYAGAHRKLGKEFVGQVMSQTDPLKVMDMIIGGLPFPYQDKQRLLEAETLEEQFGVVQDILIHETSVLEIKDSFQKQVKARVDKNQKDYILREEMKVIQKELGTDEESDADEFAVAIDALEADESVKEKLHKELKRFRTVSGNSSESTVIRTYIETMLELPWNKESEDRLDLKLAKEILDEDHYGLKKVKERMLEFLAVRALTKQSDSQIICLVGPPGTGKTSIVKSIAKALNKEYVRISLGGVRDEAEIRGHRKTYVGAMPGRIIYGLRQAKVANPVMLLDEVDKVSSDHRGETASALLEVLDGEQNHQFRDHYIEVPVDLSKVFFIATANSTAEIPGPLLDRMEVIEVNSYTENEKFHIAKEHLISKQRAKNGLTAEQFSVSDKALKKLIHAYTREAGVRSLERKIGQLCRKAAKAILMNEKTGLKVTESNLKELLGKEIYHTDTAAKEPQVGIVRGLAWTSVGGDTLEIEVNVMPGKGELKLTGHMGDVMKESAEIGLSMIRHIGKKYRVKPEFFSEHDIHIHIPEGAVPKDGPSAGVTMAVAMLSAITGKKVNPYVAMTGEITLRGRILPIGGLKEKLLAANKAGMHIVCVPKKNTADVEELSKEIIGNMKICYLETFEEAVKIAFRNK